MKNKKVDPFKLMGSALGNAYFSGVSFDQLWQCIAISRTPEELDAAIDATINMNVSIHIPK